ncbi:glycosyltransferase [Lolliginicoccus levis]|uniref:glycosyltransferase n=1 Tax=Lolliginicoccus levis TaxID=2919542 RepID=UPI00241F3554|nr:glycosyltransferase family 2 protein [Lolliginicoccus levis]
MDVSVVIPAFNEQDSIEPCLRALIDNGPAIAEIIVVDNNSTDATANIVGRIADGEPRIRLVHETTPGTAAARNRGFAEASGDIIARIDADTRVEEGWARAIVEFFAGEGVGFDAAVGAIEKYDAPLRGINRAGMALIARVSTTRSEPGSDIREVNNVVGSNMAIAQEAWDTIKAQVSHAPGIWEDVDVSLLLGATGQRIAYLPGMRAGVSGRRGRTSRQAFWRYSASLPRTLHLHGRHWEARASWITVGIMRAFYVLAWVPNRAYDPDSGRYSWSRLRTGSEHRAHPGGEREPAAGT